MSELVQVDFAALDKSDSIPGTFHSIYFVDSTTGWAAGYDPVILRTTNGGDSWQVYYWCGSCWLFDVDFADANNGCCVGMTGIFPYTPYALTTSDGGVTWVRAAVDTAGLMTLPIQLTCIDMVTADIGYAAGGEYPSGGSGLTVLKTTDGGHTWDVVMRGYATPGAEDICFVDANTGFIVFGTGQIRYTTDGWTTWLDAQTNPAKDFAFIRSATLAHDGSAAWVVGESVLPGFDDNWLMKSVDGGQTWTIVNVGSGSAPRAVFFADENRGWVVGESGTVLYTSNGGATWSDLETCLANDLLGVTVVNADNPALSKVWIVGEDGIMLTK